MSPSPDTSTALLDTVKIRLPFGTVKFEVAFVDVVSYCAAWQRFVKVILSPCGYISFGRMTILDTVTFKGTEVTGLQLRLAPLPFTHWNCARFLESFNDVEYRRGRNIQISSYLSLRNTFFKLFNNFLTCFLANWWSRPIFAAKGLGLSWVLLLYQFMTTITCWHHLFQITSLINCFTSL